MTKQHANSDWQRSWLLQRQIIIM